MIRTMLLFAVAAVAGSLAAFHAQAQGAPPDADDGRCTCGRVDGGDLRLEMRTGQVSLCNRRPVGWSCQAVADDRTALDNEIARLQGENAALKKTLLDRGLPLPGGVKSEPPAARAPDQDLKLPSNTDLDRMMSFFEKVWRRLVEMMVNIQRDMMKKT